MNYKNLAKTYTIDNKAVIDSSGARVTEEKRGEKYP